MDLKPPRPPPSTPQRTRVTTAFPRTPSHQHPASKASGASPQSSLAPLHEYRHALPASVSPLRLGQSWQDRLKQQCLDRVRNARQNRHDRHRQVPGTGEGADSSDSDTDADMNPGPRSLGSSRHPPSSPSPAFPSGHPAAAGTSSGSSGPLALDEAQWIQSVMSSEWEKLQKQLQAQWQEQWQTGALLDPVSTDPDFIAQLEAELRAEVQASSALPTTSVAPQISAWGGASPHNLMDNSSEEAYQMAIEEYEQADIESAVEAFMSPPAVGACPLPTPTPTLPLPCPQCQQKQSIPLSLSADPMGHNRHQQPSTTTATCGHCSYSLPPALAHRVLQVLHHHAEVSPGCSFDNVGVSFDPLTGLGLILSGTRIRSILYMFRGDLGR
ncbi:hypothetical protein BJ085DRAFT_32506 [Dimargaris cristalligena]|uniref:Uncharacterized protein n=1 Tax=Dimargaris cristalligena TaxID=215637 RepID=A0A4P9ZZV3_9FUNG|nr:hypothetical protein BJ085DRAFT_32506 [Dimargaris cristalligena]|eukprot:RKP39324.1 hypothetical protein BJ085DRAFT_32506 [Dimargaris cristalligena]